jgi:parvulin-like peptidyl-prolyl isomerase
MKKMSLAVITLTFGAAVSFAADKTPSKKAEAAPAKAVPSKMIKATAPVANFNFLPEVVAEVNGKKITKKELIERLLMPFGGKIPRGVNQQILENAAKSICQRMIQFQIILDEAAKAGYKPSPEAAEKGFNQYLKKMKPMQLQSMKQGLAKQNKTIESYLAENKVKKSFQEQMAVQVFLEDKVVSKCKVTAEEAKAYYDANPKKFISGDSPDMLRASHILIAVKEKTDAKSKAAAKAKAEKLLKLLKKDASLFEELAEKESQCPSGKANKGNLGAFKKGQMVPEFEKAVVNLKDGEISAVVETKFGYHIIRRNPLKKSSKIPFVKVKEQIEEGLKQEKVFKNLSAYLKKITEAAKIKNFLPVAAKAEAVAKTGAGAKKK